MEWVQQILLKAFFHQKLLNNIQGIGRHVVMVQNPAGLGEFGQHTRNA